MDSPALTFVPLVERDLDPRSLLGGGGELLVFNVQDPRLGVTGLADPCQSWCIWVYLPISVGRGELV